MDCVDRGVEVNNLKHTVFLFVSFVRSRVITFSLICFIMFTLV